MRKTIAIKDMIDYANENYTRAESIQTTVYQLLQNAGVPCKMYAIQEGDGVYKTVLLLEKEKQDEQSL